MEFFWKPRGENMAADEQSHAADFADISLSPSTFRSVTRLLCEAMQGRAILVDAFASQHNAVCPAFFSRGLEIGCAGVDATQCYAHIAQMARDGCVWAFPPFSLIYGFVAACADLDICAILVLSLIHI